MPAKPKRVSKAKPVPMVEEIEGEWFRFRVQSFSDPAHPHVVDLEEWRWNGSCGCRRMDFCDPKLAKGEAPNDKLRCSHIKAARSYFLDIVLPKFGAAINGQRKETDPRDIAPNIRSLASAIASFDDRRYPARRKVGDLMALKDHLVGLIDEIQPQTESL